MRIIISRIFFVVFLVALGASGASKASAAALPPGMQQQVEQEQQRIQQEQQRILEMERRQREVQQAIKRPPAEEAPQEEAVPADDGACIEVRSLEITGNSVLREEQLERAFEPYRGQCLSLARINALLQDLTNLYLNGGFITSRAFMPMPQTRLKEGLLEIKVIEGGVKAVSGISRRSYWTAFPGLEGHVLNLRDIEQGLEQMNRLPSNKASMDVKPTKDLEGYSDIVISNSPQGRLRVSGYTDNAGSENTGEWRAGGRLAADDILGLNEQFNFNYATAPSANSQNRDSNSYSGSLSLPFGYWTFTYNLSRSDYRSSFLLPVSGERYYYYGDSTNHNITVDRVIWRNQNSKGSFAAGLTYKDSNNYYSVADLTIYNEVASRSLSVLSFELPMTLYLPASVLYVKPSFNQGARWFGALNDSRVPYEQRAQYGAFKFYAYHSFRYGAAAVTSTLDAQITHHELFSSEAFSIGGEYSVRGFRNDSVQGDQGVSLRNDMSFDLNQIFGTRSELLSLFSPGLFFDYGYVDSNSQYQSYADLVGAGFKCGFDWKFFQASATYAAVLLKEDWMRDNAAWYLYAGLNLKF